MPQPTLARTGARAIAKFGGMPLPNGQGVMGQLDLNDWQYAAIDDPSLDDVSRQLGLAQLLYRYRSAWISDDRGPRSIKLPMLYREDATHFLGGFIQAMSEAGEQQLTFDNATYTLVKYVGVSARARPRPLPPQSWQFMLELLAKSPMWQDAAATAMAPLALVTDTGQAFTITYAGGVYAEPVWTLVVPAGNGVAINSMQLRNTMSGEFLTVNFQSVLAIPAATARTVTIDCGAMTVVDDLGRNYDVIGSFPNLYPPVGQVNPFTVIITPASGASAGLTLACSHFPRWQI